MSQVDFGDWSIRCACLALGATAISCVALILLHVVSPEFEPSWRMVSEYANGRQGWLLAIMFFAWAAGSFALAGALWPLSASTLGLVGLGLLCLAGIGQAMGGLFDINHKLHGPAAMIGIPALCAAAVVLTLALARQGGNVAPPLWSAHLPWLSFVAMLGALFLFFSALKGAGVDMAAQIGPLQALPAGVSGYVGFANRALFLASYLWVVLAALAVLRR
ncbi:DUF998 domain-containing protein [Bosea sp. CS1GBMeth4]|uniref:DUF998 domain-containing protein n=1 Tax=Bosea sp. CS1GBMeth4 TaxID=1892849 RepID=UPI001645F531|nr:DUF998 domain-containing protein [Bosea sp. CS1GBMeth4]